MTEQDKLRAAAKRLTAKQHADCDHLFNAHSQCQWCHRMRSDIDAEMLARAKLAELTAAAEAAKPADWDCDGTRGDVQCDAKKITIGEEGYMYCRYRAGHPGKHKTAFGEEFGLEAKPPDYDRPLYGAEKHAAWVEQMEGEFAPCPFCGSKVVGALLESTKPGDTLGVVGCGVCGASGPSLFDKDELTARWNQRRDSLPCCSPRPSTVP